MNRNVNSHFATNPTHLGIGRSRFNRSHSLKTSFNVGNLVPIYCEEVLPGDTFDVKTSKVVRMQPLVAPIMDNLYLDTYFFFVPNRLVWEHWKEFMGENTDGHWIPQVEYSVPQISAPEGGFAEGSLADYFGIPTKVEGLKVSALPARAYALIFNEWFRSENLTDPCLIRKDDTDRVGSNGSSYITDTELYGMPCKAAKFFDLFTAALPSPQKGPDVTIKVAEGLLPVSAYPQLHAPQFYGENSYPVPLHFRYGTPANQAAQIFGTSANYGVTQPDTSGSEKLYADDPTSLAPNNLWADIGSNVPVATVNSLRIAFQIQKFYEQAARGGTRYVELLKAMFDVTCPDYRLQRPEYLGGNRIPININQVVQTSATGVTPQGNTAAYSLTTDSHSDFIKSFTEHGFVIGLAVARYDHTYQQGLERFWSRKTRFDYYFPVFANLGEQAILNKEIYADGSAADDEVFGYQEAWYDYRYKPNHVTGEMRSNATLSLDVWHLADDYSQLPALSDSWLREDQSNLDRALVVSSEVSNQLFGDFYFENKVTRPMPLYSIPGLIDHH